MSASPTPPTGQQAPIDPEDQLDQARLDEAVRCLEAMKQRTASVTEIAARAVRDENTVDARVAEAKLQKRRIALEAGAGPLCFGRIDEEPARVGVVGDRWYVGRRHVEDEHGDAVVVDWRAPVSAPFYRATSVDPCGLERRRRFSVDDSRIEAVFDEDLTDPDGGATGGLPDPLLAELDRSRSGTMRDVVATIAGEQDEIIRSPLEDLLVVQGGPGTGKTAVGLHRAAFLLFQHREYFFDNKVLVVGPNPVFLRYVADVLPSLGETSVIQTTVTGLLESRYRVRSVDDPATAEIKGDVRIARVIERLMTSRIGALDAGLEVRSGITVIRFGPEEIDGFIARARDRRLPLNQGRDVFRSILLQEAWARYLERPGADPGAQPTFVAAIRNDAAFKKDLDRMWPMFSGPAVVRELLGSPTKRARATSGILTDDERDRLHRKGAKKATDEPWSAADLPLIDEVIARSAGVPATYGHVVVDEAQDHSAMALRMLGRRARGRSMTVLGDLAQATAPGAMTSWDEAAHHLGADDHAAHRLAELTVGYRVPSAILDVANRLLPSAAPTVTPAVAIRPGGRPPASHPFSRQQIETLIDAVAGALDGLPPSARSTALIAVEGDLDLIEAALVDDGRPVDRVGGRRTSLALPGADALALVEPDQAKGLEFDAVIVVDPDVIAEADHGLRRLYVSLTRAVQHLAMIVDRSSSIVETLGS